MLLPETERALVHRLATGQRDGRAPSIAGAVVRDGQRVWSHAIETTTDTQFRIGSLTKTFVAVLVMRLRDEGKLGLADPLEKHLADAPIRGVTIGQLLSHTAGLASETPEPWWERTPGDLRPELADLVGEDGLKHPSGSRFHYSNPGFALLGARGRGAPRPAVAGGAGVGGSGSLGDGDGPRSCRRSRTRAARRSIPGPTWSCPRSSRRSVAWRRPASCGRRSEDLCRFASLLANGADGVLSADTVAEMREPRSAPEVDSWEASYGLGMQLLRTPQRMLAGHTGSMPGFLCALWVSVEDDVGAVALANTTTGLAVGGLTAELVGIVAEREPRIPAPWRPLADVDRSLLELIGPWYWGPTGFGLKLEADRHLALGAMSGKGSRDSRFRPADDGTWIGLNGYFAGETLRPVRDDEGRLSHLDIGSFVFTREPYDTDAPIPGGVDPDGWR